MNQFGTFRESSLRPNMVNSTILSQKLKIEHLLLEQHKKWGDVPNYDEGNVGGKHKCNPANPDYRCRYTVLRRFLVMVLAMHMPVLLFGTGYGPK